MASSQSFAVQQTGMTNNPAALEKFTHKREAFIHISVSAKQRTTARCFVANHVF